MVDEHGVGLKGIRSDSTHTNYNGAEVTGVAKRELIIPVEVMRQAIKLDEGVFGGVWRLRSARGSGGCWSSVVSGVRPLANANVNLAMRPPSTSA